MKRILMCLAALVLLAGWASAQSLGELARQQRQEKKPAAKRVYTNDDIPSVTLAEPAKAEAAPAAEKTSKDKAQADDKSKKVYEVRIAEMKKEIAQLEREINVNQRENKLRTATYYADAGNAVRDPKAWAEEQRKMQAEMDTKQKALADARQKLAAAEEEARKAGVRVAQ